MFGRLTDARPARRSRSTKTGYNGRPLVRFDDLRGALTPLKGALAQRRRSHRARLRAGFEAGAATPRIGALTQAACVTVSAVP